MRRTVRVLALAGTVLVGGIGCESTITGNEGNLQFSYPADDRVFDFNKPIAVGAYLDVRVREVGNQRAVSLSDVESEDASVLDVDGFADDTFTLVGTGDGNVEIRVSANTTSGESLGDAVNMLARTPEVHVLRHTCTSEPDAAYLAGQSVYVPFEFLMANDQPVIGYGYYPVTPSDPSALVVDATHQGSQYMRIGIEGTGSTTLTSDIDGTSLQMELIEPAAIDGITDPIAFVIEDIDVGDVNLFYARPRAGERIVCQADTAMTVASDTPAICDVRLAGNSSGEQTDTANEFGWFEVEGVAEGSCAFTVTFPLGAGGAGVSQQFTYPIEP